MRIILLISLLFCINASYAQRSCGTHDYQQRVLSTDPSSASGFSQVQAHAQKSRLSMIREMGNDPLGDTLITIPVVIHLVYNTPDQNISDAQILSQIETLNRDFNRLNPDINQVPGPFAGLAADCRFRFELASVDPDGRATSGILRKQTNIQIFTDDDRIKSSAMGGDDGWDPHSYLNIWVCGLVNTLLGYASFPGEADNKDGVVIRYNVFGTVGNLQYPYNMGRTLTHELGHWFNLFHPWGDMSCGDDLVDDTPQQRGYHSGCPTFPQNSTGCNESADGELFMDFMDFTDDVCMHLFTTGQKERMRALFDSGGWRQGLLGSKGLGKPWNYIPDAIPDSGNVLSVYPNPAQQQFTLRSNRNSVILTGKTFTIYNAMGQSVMTGVIQQELYTVNVGHLQHGLYFVKVGNGTEKWLVKFIKD